MVAPVTELEGDWHLVSATDAEGKPVEFRPTNLTFKNDQYTFAYQGGQIDRRVEVYPDSKEIRYFKDDSGFVQDHYLLESDPLTIYDENRRNVFQRGHVVLTKTIPKATDEQKSRWRSGIVEILGGPSADKTWAPQLIGYGVIISPQMRIVSDIRLSDGDSKFYAQFDDGGVVPINILEEGPQSTEETLWVTFESEEPIEANHHFRLSEATVGKGDEVHFWGRATTVSENPTLELFETAVNVLDRKAPALGQTVWQLFRHDKLDGSLPVLDSNGDLLAVTIAGTNDLLLAVPVSQLKMMFPKSFGQPSESEPQPVEALPDWLNNLQGTWTVTDSPIKVDENSGGQMKEIRIDRDQWSIVWTAKPGDPDRVESLRVVRPDEKNLYAIDLVELSTGKAVYPSLYELDQAGLTFCYGYLGRRPHEISTGNGGITIRLTRDE